MLNSLANNIVHNLNREHVGAVPVITVGYILWITGFQ